MMDRRLGRYILVRRLAVGGMADIFLAKTRGRDGLDWHLVLKMVHDNHVQDRDFVDALVNEARIAVQLSHPNIVRFFDLGRADGHYYLAMEYVEGVDLSDLLSEARERGSHVPFEAAAYIVHRVCRALHYAHACKDRSGAPLNIVHRDVSPHNVLLGYTGTVKLADFGIAKANIARTQTAANVIKGKFDYMSPEHAWGDRVDGRADLFSLGVVLYQLLTGRLPFGDGEPADLLKRIHNLHQRAIVSPRSIRADVPPMLEEIVLKALSREREGRFKTAGEMGVQLTEFMREAAPTYTPDELASYLRSMFPTRVETIKADLLSGPTRAYDRDVLRSMEEIPLDDSSLIYVDESEVDALAPTVVDLDNAVQRAPTVRSKAARTQPAPGATGEFDIVTTLYLPEQRRARTASVPPPLPTPERAATSNPPLESRAQASVASPPVARAPDSRRRSLPSRLAQLSPLWRFRLLLGAAVVSLVLGMILLLLR